MQMVTSSQKNNIIITLRAIGICIIPLALWLFPPLSNTPTWTFCLFKNITGNNCYGCGITRAVFSCIHLQFSKAFAYNKFIIIIFPLLIFIWANQLFAALDNLFIVASKK